MFAKWLVSGTLTICQSCHFKRLKYLVILIIHHGIHSAIFIRTPQNYVAQVHFKPPYRQTLRRSSQLYAVSQRSAKILKIWRQRVSMNGAERHRRDRCPVLGVKEEINRLTNFRLPEPVTPAYGPAILKKVFRTTWRNDCSGMWEWRQRLTFRPMEGLQRPSQSWELTLYVSCSHNYATIESNKNNLTLTKFGSSL